MHLSRLPNAIVLVLVHPLLVAHLLARRSVRVTAGKSIRYGVNGIRVAESFYVGLFNVDGNARPLHLLPHACRALNLPYAYLPPAQFLSSAPLLPPPPQCLSGRCLHTRPGTPGFRPLGKCRWGTDRQRVW